MQDDIVQQVLEKWHYCSDRRYRTLLITPARKNKFVEQVMDEIAGIVNGIWLDFSQKYKGNLDCFFTWQQVRDQIYAQSMEDMAVVSGLEPFYSKWPVPERFAFLRNIIRLEPPKGILLILYCTENLMDINAIPENNRGIIWAL
jgi:hypothetical protein